MKSIFVTGSNGFTGSNLVPFLKQYNFNVTAADRKLYHQLEFFDEWDSLLNNVDVVIHLAGRAHVTKAPESEALTSFRTVNVLGTKKLAEAAKKSGVKRFIYLSSIKVNGKFTLDSPFSPSDTPHPSDPYAISKYEAEQVLMSLHDPEKFQVVIVRPPLIYGPGVKANFLRLVRAIKNKTLLPFGMVQNKRSFISTDNLNDLIRVCIDHPLASGEIFLASDGEALSVKNLALKIGVAVGEPARLFPIPVGLMKAGFTLIGKKDYSEQLLMNLEVDIKKTMTLLNWKPISTVDESLSRALKNLN